MFRQQFLLCVALHTTRVFRCGSKAGRGGPPEEKAARSSSCKHAGEGGEGWGLFLYFIFDLVAH